MGIKKLYRMPLVMLAIFLLSFGGFYLLANIFRYTVVPTNDYLIYIPSATIIIWLTVRGFSKRNEKTKATAVFSALLPLIAIFFIVLKGMATDTNGTNTYFFVLHSFITLVCCIIMFFSCGRGMVVKIGLGIIYSFLFLIISFLFFLMLVFANSVSITVRKSEMSPNSVYLAEIFTYDEGALGGGTKVAVTRQNRDMNFLIVELIKTPKVIYHGKYGDFENMTLRWETDKVLYVNEVKYLIR